MPGTCEIVQRKADQVRTHSAARELLDVGPADIAVAAEGMVTHPGATGMHAIGKPRASVFVDRANQRWVVRDPDGNFWTVPALASHPWEDREPFVPTEDMELEPVPSHYQYLFDLPF